MRVLVRLSMSVGLAGRVTVDGEVEKEANPPSTVDDVWCREHERTLRGWAFHLNENQLLI